METLRYTLNEKPYDSPIFREYFQGQRIAVFDIESTGLDPRNNRLILGAFLFFEEKGFSGVQYFANDLGDEIKVLRACIEELKNIDVLITFNGRRFDIPFIECRAANLGLKIPRNFFSFDIYRAVRYYSALREFLPNLKQKTVEYYLGLTKDRADKIDGGESVIMYQKYLATGAPDLREAILLHNRDDVRQLSRILRILDKLDLHNILFCEGFLTTEGPERQALAEKIAFRKDTLLAEGRTNCPHGNYCGFAGGFRGEHLSGDGHLFAEVPCHCTGDILYVMKEDFPFSFEALELSPACRDRVLILKDGDRINYREANFLIREIFKEILRNM